ncbi:MAG TPA: hypothetical protein PK878_05795 [bacterium]|nr:hypothetical protein [bacterium]HOL96441.1 hypothetical protein [bacterium]HPP03104.1 hypothetical protein [bacterium]
MRKEFRKWFCWLGVSAGVLLLTPDLGTARDFRVNLIPNGTVYGCATCHTSPAGGGARNAFGQAVEALVAPGSTAAFWSAALAAADADGDGASNGLELQDPAGTWRPGDPRPGDASKVTHPGDPNSKPVVSAVSWANELAALDWNSSKAASIDLSGLSDEGTMAKAGKSSRAIPWRVLDYYLWLTKILLKWM